MNLFRLALCLVFFLPNPSFAYDIPDDSQVLIPLTKTSVSLERLPSELNIMTWNVHKGADKYDWSLDMIGLSQGENLILLQEAVKDDFMPITLNELSDFAFWMAQSFFNKNMSTGVATGSDAKVSAISFRRSPGLEPIANTPKMTLLTVYKLESGESLLVANIHGINFTSNYEFNRQIEDLRNSISSFQGKIIFAGDFNSWNGGRVAILRKFAASLGLVEVQFPSDPRKIIFDRIFISGCLVVSSQVLSEVTSSDHYPLKATLDCK